MLSRSEGNDVYAVTSRGIKIFIISLPHLYEEFWSSTDRFALVVEIKRVASDRGIIMFVTDFPASFPRVSARNQGPSRAHSVAARKTIRCFRSPRPLRSDAPKAYDHLVTFHTSKEISSQIKMQLNLCNRGHRAQ